jgi:thymidylate synthase (FAD)
MGTDLTVVNAARVSFNKESEWLVYDDDEEYASYAIAEKDVRLIDYLASHDHFTPFTHVQITLREKVPIFVARQRFKHMIGFSYNEVSRRYVDSPPEFYQPQLWRGKPVNKKQGSSDEVVTDLPDGGNISWYVAVHNDLTKKLYNDMIASGVAPEQARMILPQSMYTEYYCTGSLAAWARAYNLRSKPDAQQEIRELASMWNNTITQISELKHSWKALTLTQ